MAPHNLVGQRVKVLAWDDLRDILPADPTGIITHVGDSGPGGVELTVRVAGLSRSFIFGLDDVKVLQDPYPRGCSSDAESG
jgi:hypothetical protein